MYERYEVARVKNDSLFGRTSYVRPKGERFDERFGEHLNSSENIKIYLVRRHAIAGHNISGQKRVAKSNLSGYVLDNYLPMRSDSKHSTKYIHELTIILISPDGSNDLPHFAMLIRLYDV